jgi:hypothetical protein
MIKPTLSTLVLSSHMLAVPAWAASPADDFAASFSTSTASHVPWQYGWSSTLGGAFAVDSTKTLHGPASEVVAWSPSGTFWPTVALNTSNSAVSFGAGNVITLQGQQGLLHPGSGGEYAVVRYTFGTDRDATLQTRFAGVDRSPTTSDVHVLLNGVSLFDGSINAYGQTQTFSQTRNFRAGDVVDFAVGPGGNGYVDDSTGFTASFSSPVPEPGTPALMLAGLGAMLLIARRGKA